MATAENQSIADLLRRARAGNQRELSRLFEACRGYLALVARAHVERSLQSKMDASDIVQQTLLEAYRGFARFHGTTSGEWLTWLRRILEHNAADFVRQFHGTGKRAARREIPLHYRSTGSSSAAWSDPADSGESPSQRLIREERELQLADALQRLSPDHSEVIMLRNLQRLPFGEVARRMGRSRPAVQMLWMRAIHKLQEALGPDPDERTSECP
jgi:RNA polymerase sigma-70 factor (ECF subfamily)